MVDLALSAQYLCCQFFDQHFQSTKTPAFVRKHFEQLLCSIFLIFSQTFHQALHLIFHAFHVVTYVVFNNRVLNKCRVNYVMLAPPGNQLFEACQLFLSIRLEDLVQPWTRSFNHAAVCVGFSLSQCCS